MSSPADSQLFERILRPHLDRLYRLAWRLAGNKVDAEDLFQDLLIKAFGKLDELAGIEQPGSWLSRVMYNLFIDERRRYTRRRLHVVDEGQLPGDGLNALPGADDPAADTELAAKLARLDAALKQLSDEQRIIVLLHDTEGYKLAEIETLTGVPVGTVKSRLHRARARLRQILEDQILEDNGTFSRTRTCRDTGRTTP